jgi:hypothetical protein
LLVGGWAVGIHGFPRATKDIDFLIAVDQKNLNKLKKALNQFGAPSIDMSHFKVHGNFFRMGRSPVQIDVITDAAGINFKECYARKEDIIVDNTLINVISRDDLIKNKRATGRTRDIADAETLEKWNKKRKNNARGNKKAE